MGQVLDPRFSPTLRWECGAEIARIVGTLPGEDLRNHRVHKAESAWGARFCGTLPRTFLYVLDFYAKAFGYSAIGAERLSLSERQACEAFRPQFVKERPSLASTQ